MIITLDTISNITKERGTRFLFENEICGGIGETIIEIELKVENTEEDIDRAIEALCTYKNLIK